MPTTMEPSLTTSPVGTPTGILRVVAEKFGSSRKPGTDSEDAADVFASDGVTIAVLADGLGSAKEGRAAALRTVAALKQSFPVRPQQWNAGRACEEIVRHLNRRLWQEGMARFESPEIACTVAVAALEGNRLYTFNAGDSRIYLWRDGQLKQISIDHRESAPQQSHVLTRALGLIEELSFNVVELPLQPHDIIFLCSDGVSDVLTDSALANLLSTNASATEFISQVARHASDETRDDATAITVRVQEIGSPRNPRQQALRVPAELKVGDVVDGFTLRRSFRATDRIWLATRQGDSYVLKFALPAASHDEAALALFIRETWHATQLQSEFFPRSFVPEGVTTRFYAQEYVHAPTLKKHLADHGPLSPPQDVELGRFLLRAEQFLLGFGFAHGDLKPENILVIREEHSIRFKLIDLGSVGEIFSFQGRAGTPSYLAPERFTGAPMTERTEIFAIGAVLYEALAGRLPYGEIEPFQKPSFSGQRALTVLNHHVPPWLEAVIMRATAANPERRQQSYSEMLFELEHPSKVSPFFQPGTPLLERNPLLFYKIGFFVMLAVALILGALLLAHPAK